MGGYVSRSTGIDFSIEGFTNPNDSKIHEFTITTKYLDGSDLYDIENFSGMDITAAEGICTVMSVYVTDGDTRIYAEPSSYTFTMWCNHSVLTDYGIRITWPDDYIVKDSSSCSFTGYATRYNCQLLHDSNIIEIRDFTDDIINATDLITFTID